jgi:uncharacterized metal-binding protein YceD (DUF177 family)
MNTPEFSRKFTLHEVQKGKLFLDFKASTTECQNVAKRLGLIKVSQLSVQLTFSKDGKAPIFILEGTMHAIYEQACVISLDPIPVDAFYPLHMLFTDNKGLYERSLEDDLDEEELIDFIEHKTLDVGEAVVQVFALSLDPYLKSSKTIEENVNVCYKTDDNNNDIQKTSPFQSLKDFKKRLDNH